MSIACCQFAIGSPWALTVACWVICSMRSRISRWKPLMTASVVISAVTPKAMPRMDASEMKEMKPLRRLARRYRRPMATGMGLNMAAHVARRGGSERADPLDHRRQFGIRTGVVAHEPAPQPVVLAAEQAHEHRTLALARLRVAGIEPAPEQ